MSSKQFLVIVRDYPGQLAKRVEVREAHLSAVSKNEALIGGGAIFSKEPTPEDPMPFAGSAMIFQADSRDAVIEILKKDIYYKSGVWDVDNAEIIPMKLATIRQP